MKEQAFTFVFEFLIYIYIKYSILNTGTNHELMTQRALGVARTYAGGTPPFSYMSIFPGPRASGKPAL